MKIDPNRLTPIDKQPLPQDQPQTDSAPVKLDQDTVDRLGAMQQYYQDLFKSNPTADAESGDASGKSLADLADEAGDQKMYGMSSGGGGTPVSADSAKAQDADKSKKKSGLHDGHYTDTFIDLNGDKQVAIGGDKTMPKDVRDLGLYKGGKTIGEFDAFVSKHQRVIEGEGDWGKAFFKAQSNIIGVQGRLFYEGKFDSKDMTAKAGIGVEAKVELIGAYYNLGYETPSIDLAGHKLNINASATITASVQARGFGLAEVSVGKDTYLKLSGEAFAGVSTSLEGSLGVGEFADVHGGMTAYAGVGAKGSITMGLEDGKLSFDAEGGLSAGLGFGVDFGFDINLIELGETAVDLGKEGLDAAGGAMDWLGGVASDMWAGAAQTANAAGAASEDAADAAGDVVDAVVDTAEGAADAVVDFVSDAADW